MGMQRYRFDGGTAVVTGAASGIGAALAAALADRGSNLALVDRDGVQLHAVAEEIQGRHRGLEVRSFLADLAETSELGSLATQICQELGSVTLLVNNAGIALAGTFEQISLSDFDAVMRTNFDATVHLTHHLLPTLKAAAGSHVVNMSSVYGLVAPPGQTAYAASKFAIRGFTESLRHELAASGVGVTAVHPGGVRTRIALNARIGEHVGPADAAEAGRRAARVLTLDPRVAAETILDGVERRKARVLVGSSAKIPDALARLAPAHAWQLTMGTVGLASRRPHWRGRRDHG
jgi:short-subunit dehydrogenase